MKYSLSYDNFSDSNVAWNKMWILHPNYGKFALNQNKFENHIDDILLEDLWRQLQNSIHIPIGVNLLRQVESIL